MSQRPTTPPGCPGTGSVSACPPTAVHSPVSTGAGVEAALLAAFGRTIVGTSGRKHIHVAAGSTTLDADIVPCFRLLRYDRPGGAPRQGIRLYPKLGGMVENCPEQNRGNGVAKNNNTGRRYKQLVRAMKRVEKDMVQNGRLQKEVHGYVIEYLLYNIQNPTLTDPSYKTTAMNILADGTR
jgi:hypothetical protein